jgi:ATP-dependent exoDNAse (exonuclease V) alpha subunit
MADRIERALGDGAVERVAADPWCVLEVPGVAPQAADALARAALEHAEPTDPRRSRALVSWLLRRAAAAGHTVQGADVIAEALGKFNVTDATGAIADAIEHGAALAFAEPLSLAEDADDAQIEEFEQLDAEDDDNPVAMLTSSRTLLTVERWAFAEQSAAEAAQRLAATPEAVESKQGADSADALIAAVAEHGLTLVTGASAARLAELVEAFPAALLTSASAGGLRTLAATGAEALDARRLADDPERVSAADVLVVADAQLLGVELGTVLLESARDGAHVVLAGDPATLIGGGPGALFRDLLEIDDPSFGGQLPRVELKQRPTGPLSALADAVRYGGLPPQELLLGPDGTSKDVVIVPVREAGEAVHRAVQVAAESVPRAFGLSGRQVQVVAVDAESAAGANALNAALKARLNAGPGACGGFDAGDRVIVASPLPEHGLLGGETGTVSQADAQGLTVTWDAPHDVRDVEGVAAPQSDDDAVARGDGDGDGDGDEDGTTESVESRGPAGSTESQGSVRSAGSAESRGAAELADTFTVSEARAFRHAWALTVAEAQGGRWPAVVAVFDGESAPKLTRALVLGAVMSATQHLTVVHGAGRALSEAVEKIPDRPRRTRLKHALRD